MAVWHRQQLYLTLKDRKWAKKINKKQVGKRALIENRDWFDESMGELSKFTVKILTSAPTLFGLLIYFAIYLCVSQQQTIHDLLFSFKEH